MRRKDREMPLQFAHQVIDKATYGVVSMIDGEMPYSVPLSIVRSGDVLYFHSAMQGRKVDVLVLAPGLMRLPIHEVALSEGVLL